MLRRAASPDGPGGTGTPGVSPSLPRGPDAYPIPFRWRAALAVLSRLPQGALSRAFGRLSDVPLPPFARPPVFTTFARLVGADLSEAELPPSAYPSLGALFVRRLRPGLRPWPHDPASAGSPVDGVVGQLGSLRSGRALQAKGRSYAVAELLGDAKTAERFGGGYFVTLYLSPRHYHRVHAPIGGRIPLARHVPGALMPVNAPAVASIPDLFARNERVFCLLEGSHGTVAVVAVGAYNVGRISTAFDPEWRGEGRRPRVAPREPETRAYDPALVQPRGGELMAFHLGSTVVLLLEPSLRLASNLAPGAEVRVGQLLARPA